MSYPQLLTAEVKLADAKEQLGIPTIVCICGSTRFMREMAEHRLPSRRQLRSENDQLACRVIKLAGEVDDWKRQFDEASVNYSGVLEDRRNAEERADLLQRELAAAITELHCLRLRQGFAATERAEGRAA